MPASPLERAPLTIESDPGARRERQADGRAQARGRLRPVRARRRGARPRAEEAAGGKRDLRKLGEWIKLKRELEARKSQDDDDIE